MAITPRIKPAPSADEAAVERVINRGLAQVSPAPSPEEDPEKKFTLRLPGSTFKRIEDDARGRPGRVSVNTWIMEAIEEKLARSCDGKAPS